MKDASGVLTLLKKVVPIMEERGVFFDFIVVKTKYAEQAQWVLDRNMIEIPKKMKPFNAMLFGKQQQAISMWFENLALTEALFERLNSVAYDFVFTLGIRSFPLLDLYELNNSIPIWSDMNIQAWLPEHKEEFRYLHQIPNLWVSTHSNLEEFMREELNVKNFFPMTYPIDLNKMTASSYQDTEDRLLVIGHKREDKVFEIDKLDSAFNGRLRWLTGLSEKIELKHGKAYPRLDYEEYKRIMKTTRFGVCLSKYECLGIAVLEQAAHHPVFIRIFPDDPRHIWHKNHAACPTWTTFDELRELIFEYSDPEKWQRQVDRQRKYIEENFSHELLVNYVEGFLESISEKDLAFDGKLTKTISVRKWLENKGWEHGSSAIKHFRNYKRQGIETFETPDETFFVIDEYPTIINTETQEEIEGEVEEKPIPQNEWMDLF